MNSKKVDADIELKVVLVGESGIGKTCIIHQYLEKQFDPNTQTSMPGTYLHKFLNVNKKKISLDIWDTAGQETYKSIVKNFYKNVSIGILVYDITLSESFQQLKDYWYEELVSVNDDSMVLAIVGNKSDLMENEAVSQQEAEEYANNVGAVFQLTSAKENFGIEELFENCTKKYLEKNYSKQNNQKKGQTFLKDKKDEKKKNCC